MRSQTGQSYGKATAGSAHGIGRKEAVAGIIASDVAFEVPLPQRIRRARRLSLAAGSLMCLVARASAAETDPWWGQDKALHFSGCLMLAGDGYATASVLSKRDSTRLLAGFGLAVAAGASKEAYDKTGAGDPSWRDLTWDVVGGATGVAISWLIDRYLF
jgi:uncharacterized protein YfiM (DUF2279 family)